MEKPEKWFRKYGYFLIVANRFLAGTRAAIALFSGISKLDIKKSLSLSAVSGLAWNSMLIGFGYVFADNIELVKEYIQLYGKIVAPLILIILAFFIIKWIRLLNKKDTIENEAVEN